MILSLEDMLGLVQSSPWARYYVDTLPGYPHTPLRAGITVPTFQREKRGATLFTNNSHGCSPPSVAPVFIHALLPSCRPLWLCYFRHHTSAREGPHSAQKETLGQKWGLSKGPVLVT